jgi:predicted hotdog family 3-hydroxylacyl-ACP dehydratase
VLDRDAILALIPHQSGMCLLDRVVDWNESRILAATATHRAPDNPLRSGGRLRALHLCEYGAQAMAVHGSLAGPRRTGGSAGMLVSLRDVRLHVDCIDSLEGELLVDALRLLDGGSSWQYAFRVLHGERVLAEGRTAAMNSGAG